MLLIIDLNELGLVRINLTQLKNSLWYKIVHWQLVKKFIANH